MAKRANNRVVGIKIETTPGVDAVPVSPTDVIDLAAFDLSSGIQFIEIDELVAALDKAPPVRGPVQPTANIRVQLKGASTPTTTPQIAPLLRIAGLEQIDDNTAVPPTGTDTATGGTATTFTIDRSVDTDWSATNDAYVGRVVQLTGNPSTATLCTIIGYAVAGNIVTVTVDRTFSPVLSTATLASVLPGKRFRPHSGVIPTASVYDWTDGILTRLLGSMADLTVNGRNGQPFELSGSLRAQFPLSPRSDVALPSYTPSRTFRPPIWRNGALSYALRRVAGSALTLALGNDLQNPPNPNAEQSIDPTELVGRTVGGDLSLLLVDIATRDAMADALNQTVRQVTAYTDVSQAAGNRWAVWVPGAQFTDHRNAAEQAFAAEQMPYRSTNTNALAGGLTMF